MYLVDRINKVFKTDDEAVKFFLEHVELKDICKICKKNLLDTTRENSCSCSLYLGSEFRVLQWSYKNFRFKLAILYFSLQLKIFFRCRFNDKKINLGKIFSLRLLENNVDPRTIYKASEFNLRQKLYEFTDIKNLNKYEKLLEALAEKIREF